MIGSDCLETMAREWYGYGRWEAPYWFIGPEPGNPEGDNLEDRCAAWNKLGRGELLDCKDHHIGFGWCEWHRESPPPPTQPTWRQLIRFLLALKRLELTLERIRCYQQRQWGMRNEKGPIENETCVIELCSLAAKSLRTKKNVAFDPIGFRARRIEVIKRKIAENNPKVVVMYGTTDKKPWREIAQDKNLAVGRPTKVGQTCFVMTEHPVGFGLGKDHWLQLAAKVGPELSDRD